MGNLARDVLFRMPARDDSETALAIPIEYMYPPKWLRSLFITDQTLTQLIVRELCTLTLAEQF